MDNRVLISKENEIEQSTKTRQLPSWLKRAPSEHDIKTNLVTTNENIPVTDKTKKKPKLNI